MRVTQEGILQRALAGATQRWSEIARLEEAVASGKRVRSPGDDPSAYRAALATKRALALAEGAKHALALAEARLAASESALHELGNLLTRARALAVRMTNAAVTAAERQAAAAEAQHLLSEALAAANRRWQGEALFAGTNTSATPYALQAGGIVYTGDQGQRTIAIAPGRSVAAGIPGGTAELLNALAALKGLADALAAGKANLGAEIGALTAAHEGVVRRTAEAGAALASVRREQAVWDEMRTALVSEQARRTGADLPATIARLNEARNALQALYLAITRMQSLSLVNWLR